MAERLHSSVNYGVNLLLHSYIVKENVLSFLDWPNQFPTEEDVFY